MPLKRGRRGREQSQREWERKLRKLREKREGSPPAAFMGGGEGTEEGERRVRETFVKNMI